MVESDAWRSAFQGAVVGALVMRGVRNSEESAALEAAKRGLEEDLRGAAAVDAESDEVLRAYVNYYRARGSTYHVNAQRESVALRGKAIPSRAALVEAMFMAELVNLILTAGHNLDAMTPPVRLDVTTDGDAYVLLNGTQAVLEPSDMMMSHHAGIVSSVLRGPDLRTRITPQTGSFAADAPAGVGEGAVRRHLEDIRAKVQLVAPEAKTDELSTLTAA